MMLRTKYNTIYIVRSSQMSLKTLPFQTKNKFQNPLLALIVALYLLVQILCVSWAMFHFTHFTYFQNLLLSLFGSMSHHLFIQDPLTNCPLLSRYSFLAFKSGKVVRGSCKGWHGSEIRLTVAVYNNEKFYSYERMTVKKIDQS